MKNNHKLYYIGFILIISVLIFVLTFSYLNREKQEEKLVNTKTEQDPLLTRFPNIGNIDECYWQADVISKDRNSIGSTSYWMKGFIRLEKDETEKNKKNFKWQPVESGWRPSISISEMSDISNQWFYSDDYNNYILSNNFYGSFYYNFEEEIIFFDIQR